MNTDFNSAYGENLLLQLFEIREVISDRSPVSAWDLILVQRALGFGLRGGRGFFELNLALAFDGHAFERDARHLASGRHLAFHLGRLERVAQAVVAVTDAARVHVRTLNAGVVHGSLLDILRIIGPAGLVRPRTNPAGILAAA